MRNYLMIAFLFVCKTSFAQVDSVFHPPQKGFTSWQPATSWEHALLSGNGTMGAMVIGQPHDETIILSHSALYLPRKRSAQLINQAAELQHIRHLMQQGKFEEAARVPVTVRKQEGYNDERDPFIPAFDLRVQQEPANISRYQRSTNYQTGEAVVDWQDDNGIFQRRLFVSRADSVIVLSIKGTARINATISFARRPVEWNQRSFVNEHINGYTNTASDNKWLYYHSAFTVKNANSIQAYEGVGKVIAKNGSVTIKGNACMIADADEVLVLIRIQPLFSTASERELIKQSLSTLSTNYTDLLTVHETIHKPLFNKVQFHLDAKQGDRKLHTEEILLKAQTAVPLAMIEKAFDASRYNIISATGYNPPNLQGIWSGTWTAPWTSGMTNDGNLATAVAFNLAGNNPVLMDAFFDYHERLLPDYRVAAKALYNTRGIHIPAQSTTTGYDTDFNETWCLTFWTGAAGWVSNSFWDTYQYTKDQQFLAARAYPFMKESLLFYEDFLIEGADGKYVFIPSYSPENNPGNSKSQAAINATMDVMIAKQLLRNCIAAANILKLDQQKVKQWQIMLGKMPAYEVAVDGTLKEWLWKEFTENHKHRHASQLYALFDEIAPEFKNDERLRAAALKVIEEKMKFREKEGGGEMAFGLAQLGIAAAHLGDAEKAYQLLQWLAGKYWSNGMGSFHNVQSLFNTDISGGLPYLVSQMLTYSEPGIVSLLPALPMAWKTGSINGLLLRGNIVIKELTWNEKQIHCTLVTPISQKIKLQFPFSVRVNELNVTATNIQSKGFELMLPAAKEINIVVQRVE
jgi:alpha-L-fucosidase 2